MKPFQPVITLMFDARLRQMAKELATMLPVHGLDPVALRELHEQTARLLGDNNLPAHDNNLPDRRMDPAA